jgi:predicted dehydrogenase
LVGFNRSCAQLAVQVREEVETIPLPSQLARVNAGRLQADHWTHDPEDGGGRLIGEGCHFVDLLSSQVRLPLSCTHWPFEIRSVHSIRDGSAVEVGVT